ncbi:MAG: 2,3,4,5-tetrahydropyridine-2,6-dicarboxylate N-succinyltransferase, partial [Acidimicrobiia bacterium]
MTTRSASGLGLATIAADGTVLDTAFPSPVLDSGQLEEAGFGAGTTRLDAEQAKNLGHALLAARIGSDADRGVELVAVTTI